MDWVGDVVLEDGGYIFLDGQLSFEAGIAISVPLESGLGYN